MRFVLTWTLAVLANCLAIPCVATAQTEVPGAGTGNAANTNMVTQFKGKLKSFQRGVLLVSRDDGTDVMIQPPDDPSSFRFVAEAKPAFLQRGAMVRFTGLFGPNGVSLSPIERVEVFRPMMGQKLPGHLRERYLPGVYAPRGGDPQAGGAMGKYNIVGGLMAISPDGLMMVQAGKTPVKVQLAAEAKFELRFHDLSLAQEGDPVSVAGFYQPPDDTKVKADSVTITTDRIYGIPTDGPPKRKSRRRVREVADAPDKEAGEAKPAEENSEKEDVPAVE